MSRRRYTPEQIIGMLREAEIRLSQGQTVGEICRGFGVSEQSYYRWRREYGGMEVSQAHRLKELEREAQVLIEQWRCFYNTERPHSSLGYCPPAPKAILPPVSRLAYAIDRASLPPVRRHARF